MTVEQTFESRPMPGALRYDLMLFVASRGREGRFRKKQVELAHLAPGESVLDVGCGTGTLAIAAARSVGTSGTVYGIDPAENLLARARSKARRARVDVDFRRGTGEALPFEDASLDVVLTTLVFHHLPHEALRGTVHELRRALKPGGRALIVDIGGVQDAAKPTLHAPHGGHLGFDLRELAPRLEPVGLTELESGPVESGMPRLEKLWYILAAAVS
jgi:ubiquinone/menaquinone biosynthesis C-methylase UbiE